MSLCSHRLGYQHLSVKPTAFFCMGGDHYIDISTCLSVEPTAFFRRLGQEELPSFFAVEIGLGDHFSAKGCQLKMWYIPNIIFCLKFSFYPFNIWLFMNGTLQRGKKFLLEKL